MTLRPHLRCRATDTPRDAVLAVYSIRVSLRETLVRVVEATQDRDSVHTASHTAPGCSCRSFVGDLLLHTLMRPGAIEVGHVLLEDALQVRLTQDQEVIQAFAPHTPQGVVKLAGC